jgi:hypothetical protein
MQLGAISFKIKRTDVLNNVLKLNVLGSGGIALCILNLGTRWRWVISFTPWPLYRRYPLARMLGGPQNQYERDDEDKNSHSLPEIGPLSSIQ